MNKFVIGGDGEWMWGVMMWGEYKSLYFYNMVFI